MECILKSLYSYIPKNNNDNNIGKYLSEKAHANHTFAHQFSWSSLLALWGVLSAFFQLTIVTNIVYQVFTFSIMIQVIVQIRNTIISNFRLWDSSNHNIWALFSNFQPKERKYHSSSLRWIYILCFLFLSTETPLIFQIPIQWLQLRLGHVYKCMLHINWKFDTACNKFSNVSILLLELEHSTQSTWQWGERPKNYILLPKLQSLRA